MLSRQLPKLPQRDSIMPRTVVLVCTCDRPDSLRSLLVRLASQVCEHHASLVITDNGSHSSEEIVKDFVEVCPIVYKRIKEPGLVVARNEALRLALTLTPDYLAFVDDDEVPREGWITNLLKAMNVSGADIVNGPVFPDFVIEPPRWARDGEFFSKSGKTLGTSNLLLRATWLPRDEKLWFQPQFNFSGGEDNEFLNRLVRNGAVHAVAKDAVVQEYIPATRLRKQYM